ncbi:MAG: aspartate kinase [bacterium]|nr:aspartate kinase [bacterium]
MKGIKVLKFGGTSMGSASAIKKVIAIIRKPQQDARIAAVVVSAMSGVTNELIKCAQLASAKKTTYKNVLRSLERRHIDVVGELVSPRYRAKTLACVDELFRQLESVVEGTYRLQELSPAGMSYIMSFGERLSGHILAGALLERHVRCEYLNARHVITTDEHFESAAVNFARTDKAVRAYFKKHTSLQVVTGFIGATPDGKTTTLGRGGSDYSAAIVGAALRAKAIEIWTDVSGIMTADPRLVSEAKVVPELSFEEAGELAYFGAKVLHPKTILPAMRRSIPVKVLNTFMPVDKGTTIVPNFAQRRKKSHTVDALTFKGPVIAVHINSPKFFDGNGFIARIFEIFNAYRTSIDVVATSVTSVSVTIDDEKNLSKIIKDLKELGDVSIERGKAIICAVGGAVNAAGVAGRMFTVLGQNKIAVEMISQASSGVSMTFVVGTRDAEKALKVLHKEYIEK